MLDPNEPDTHTQETTEQPTAQPPRRRRAASRAAGPPSSAPDAPTIERAEGLPGTAGKTVVPEQTAHSDEAPADGEVASSADSPAKKAGAKRTTKRVAKEASSEAEVPPKAARKRTAKKVTAMAAQAPSADEAHTVLTEPGEPVPIADFEATTETEIAVEAGPENELEAPGTPAEEVQSDATSGAPPEAASEVPVVTDEPLETTDESSEVPAEVPDAAETAPEAAEEAMAESGEGRRRRRRRGGRRRRRTTGEEAATTDEASTEGEQPEDEEPAAVSDASDTNDEVSRRRRRRRRRRGEEAVAAADDPTDTVLRVREPRQGASTAVAGIDGSTRMEAKRQRRREGREAGRRRTPVLSEAEFLARRESVVRKMIIRQRDNLSQIAVLEDDILVEHYVDRESTGSLIGNVYLGRVQNVLPSMEAAFVDIGRGRNGVIYAGEVDWDYFGAEGQNRKVEKVLKSGQTILVQVTKDPVGAKGARLTNHVSIPGRYIVYAPGGHLSGISRKLPEIERRRLKEVLSGLVGESASVIVRTAAEGASEDELVRDVNRLKAQWEDIERKIATGNAPQLL